MTTSMTLGRCSSRKLHHTPRSRHIAGINTTIRIPLSNLRVMWLLGIFYRLNSTITLPRKGDSELYQTLLLILHRPWLLQDTYQSKPMLTMALQLWKTHTHTSSATPPTPRKSTYTHLTPGCLNIPRLPNHIPCNLNTSVGVIPNLATRLTMHHMIPLQARQAIFCLRADSRHPPRVDGLDVRKSTNFLRKFSTVITSTDIS